MKFCNIINSSKIFITVNKVYVGLVKMTEHTEYKLRIVQHLIIDRKFYTGSQRLAAVPSSATKFTTTFRPQATDISGKLYISTRQTYETDI